MVKDIENAFDELVAHDLIAAIAGDEECREAVRSPSAGTLKIDSVSRPAISDPPRASPVAGRNLVIGRDYGNRPCGSPPSQITHPWPGVRHRSPSAHAH
jgi:hypothetical protein